MRRLLKFLHTMGAIGFLEAPASLLVVLRFAPPLRSLGSHRLIRGAMAAIAAWVVFPSFALTLIPRFIANLMAPSLGQGIVKWGP